MKRDFKLIQLILNDIEGLAPGHRQTDFSFENFQQDVVQAHVNLIFEKGYLEGRYLDPEARIPLVEVLGITWAGYDYLDQIRKPMSMPRPA